MNCFHLILCITLHNCHLYNRIIVVLYIVKSEIVITNLSSDPDDLNYFEIALTNGICKVTVPLYAIDELKKFGQQLINFPITIEDVVFFQDGQDGEEWAYYLTLKAFCYDSNGHVALQINGKSTGDIVTRYQATFSLLCEAASINRLGLQITNWLLKTDKRLIWKSIQ